METLIGNKVYAKDLKQGNIIELPTNAQIGRRQFVTHPQPAAFWAVTYGVSSATLWVCPPLWYVGLEAVQVRDGFEADEMAHSCCNKWLLPLRFDGWIKVLSESASEYLEGLSHAAA